MTKHSTGAGKLSLNRRQFLVLAACGTQLDLSSNSLASNPLAWNRSGADSISEDGGATYFVDAENGKDERDGLSPRTAWRTIARINDSFFRSGDAVLFQRGQTWREELRPKSDGARDSPIIFAAYGQGPNPVLSGADVVLHWKSELIARHDKEPRPVVVFHTRFRENPAQVFELDLRLKLASGKTSMRPGSYWWDASRGRLFVRCTGDRHPKNCGIEVSTRANGALFDGRNHIFVTNLDFQKAAQYGLFISGGCADVAVEHCRFRFSGHAGYFAYDGANGAPSLSQPDLRLRYCEASWNNGTGILCVNRVDRMKIQNCVAHHNCLTDGQDNYQSGIRIVSDFVPDEPQVTYNRPQETLIEYCVAHDNGRDGSGRQAVSGERGHGIWMDTVGRNSIMRYNIAFNNAKSGIYYEWGGAGSGGLVHGNLSYENEVGILLYRQTEGCTVAHNTAWRNQVNIMISGDVDGMRQHDMHGNIIANNIAVAATHRQLVAQFGGEDVTGETGNVYKHNALGPEDTRFVSWGAGRTVGSYRELETVSGHEMSNIDGDACLSAPDHGNFRPRPDSPCVAAGVVIPKIENDLFGNIYSDPPTVGAVELERSPVAR